MSNGSKPVGIVGLGKMGSRMSRRLTGAGHDVVGYDARPVSIDGVGTVEDLGQLVREAETVVLSLPDGSIVAEVCQRILAVAGRTATTIVDTSTIGPRAARSIAAALAEGGVRYVDAPVSGGIGGAEAGTLSMMVATDRATYERLEPVLAPIAKNRFLVGDEPGQGQTMKLLNNFLSATALLATSEAVAFGVRHGLDPALIVDVLNVSSGMNTASRDKFPQAVLPGTYDYGFSAHLMRKDVRLYREHVEGSPDLHGVADVVAEMWGQFEEAAADSDATYIYEWVRTGGRLDA